MLHQDNKKIFWVAVLVITAALMFILFAVLGLNGVSIASPSSGLLIKLLILLAPTFI